MVELREALTTSVITAGLVGGTHYAAHTFYGNADAFAQAGVMEAGIAVTLATFVLSFGGMRGWFL